MTRASVSDEEAQAFNDFETSGYKGTMMIRKSQSTLFRHRSEEAIAFIEAHPAVVGTGLLAFQLEMFGGLLLKPC